MAKILQGFRRFAEEKDAEDPKKYVATIKKQFGVPKKLWLGMPLLVSNTKLGDYMITSPTMFYVSDLNGKAVTITTVKNPTFTNDDDPDNEIDMDEEDPLEVTINIDDFYALQTPQLPPNGGSI